MQEGNTRRRRRFGFIPRSRKGAVLAIVALALVLVASALAAAWFKNAPGKGSGQGGSITAPTISNVTSADVTAYAALGLTGGGPVYPFPGAAKSPLFLKVTNPATNPDLRITAVTGWAAGALTYTNPTGNCTNGGTNQVILDAVPSPLFIDGGSVGQTNGYVMKGTTGVVAIYQGTGGAHTGLVTMPSGADTDCQGLIFETPANITFTFAP